MDEITINQKQIEDCEITIDQGKTTFVIVAAQHNQPHKNYLTKIPCKKGVPMAGHVYDAKHDSYFFPCVDFLLLGTVDAAAYVKSRSNNWSIRVPLSHEVLLHFVGGGQKNDLKHFVGSYDPVEHTFHYLQLIDPNESFPPVKQSV